MSSKRLDKKPDYRIARMSRYSDVDWISLFLFSSCFKVLAKIYKYLSNIRR